MANRRNLSVESYVRDLSFSAISELSSMLDPLNTWEQLAAQIPVKLNDLFHEVGVPFQARYVTRSFMKFQASRSPTKALLEDWGYKNCQLRHLIQALLRAQLIETATYVGSLCGASEIPHLSGGGSSQPSVVAAAAPINGGLGETVMSLESGMRENKVLQDAPPEPPKLLEPNQHKEEDLSKKLDDTKFSGDLIHGMPEISFEILSHITRNFDEREIMNGGSLIGTGGFGDVFLGEYLVGDNSAQPHQVAVKRLKSTNEDSWKQFATELKTLCTYKHEHLVTLLGYSSDGAFPCLVYEYVLNGSLEDRLACLHNSPPLSVPLRMEIARGTARGIAYLHEKDVTHRDIKSANILLDADFKPKVSDFATARTLPQSADMKTQVMHTTTIIGTTSYLAPEAYYFKIHHGLDVFSFGVVLLELLTGLPVFDRGREEEDLKSHVKECCASSDSDDDDVDDCKNGCGAFFKLLDTKPGVVWDPKLVENLYTLANQCLVSSMSSRKKIDFVLSKLHNMDSHSTENR